jgi:hypothetical protein
MSNEKGRRTDTRATISGPVSGQVAVGSGITQTQSVAPASSAVSEEDVRALRQLIRDLEARVAAEAPPETRAAALERVKELEEAVTAEVPDLTTLEYVRQWFGKHLPTVVGSVTALVIHPLVGKIVGAAGDTVVEEFRRRFGST